MKILVTGLCLQGNKGGQAIALSLKKQLENHLDSTSFTFSVPSGEEFQYEITESDKYNIEIVENFSAKDFIFPFCLKKFPSRLKRFFQWLFILSSSDLLLEMSAISYVGPPIGSQRIVLLSGRFLYFVFSKLFNKPFFAWTQSYGPFSTPLVKFLAKLDLGSQPIIFCRGDDCLNSVKTLLPQTTAKSFPDVAVLLEYNVNWGQQYIKSINDAIEFEKLVTISPSAVIFSKTEKSKNHNSHIQELISLCQYLTNQGYFILLVPHTYRPNRPNPKICDFAVSQLVFEQLKENSSVSLLNENISAIELKSIISCAYIHIGARYHTIVASLSSGVPCISLSWHQKYKDIMRMYGSTEFVHDSVNNCSQKDLYLMFEKLKGEHLIISKRIQNAQLAIEKQVNKNTELFIELIKKSCN